MRRATWVHVGPPTEPHVVIAQFVAITEEYARSMAEIGAALDRFMRDVSEGMKQAVEHGLSRDVDTA